MQSLFSRVRQVHNKIAISRDEYTRHSQARGSTLRARIDEIPRNDSSRKKELSSKASVYSFHSMPVSVIFSRSREQHKLIDHFPNEMLDCRANIRFTWSTRRYIKELASALSVFQIRIPLSRTLAILFATPRAVPTCLSFFLSLFLSLFCGSSLSCRFFHPPIPSSCFCLHLHSSGLAYCLVHLSPPIHSHGFLSLSLPQMNLRAVLVSFHARCAVSRPRLSSVCFFSSCRCVLTSTGGKSRV